jgi:uncharacterized protein YbjT (DUF2867 family)
MRVAVTGATGNTGVHVVRELLAQGAHVVALGGQKGQPRTALPAGVELRPFDYAASAGWSAAVAGCDSLFLLRPPAISNVQETLIPFARQALQQGVKHTVFLSVAGADTNRIVPHHKVEVFLRSTESYTILRPGFFAQNLQDAYRRDILEQDRIYVPAGQGKVAFVDLRDVALVAAKALVQPAEHLKQGYTLTGPQAVSFAQAAQMLSHCLGREIRYQAASITGYLWHLRRRRLPWMQAFVQTILHVGLRFGQAETVDPTLRRLVGREPFGLDRYIQDHSTTWQIPAGPRETNVQGDK